MFQPAFSNIALKEWAPAIHALGSGDQIILLHNIGILQQGRLPQQQFFLYPHLKEKGQSLVKPQFQKHLEKAIDEDDTPGLVFFTHWAEVTAAFQADNPSILQAVLAHHICTKDHLPDSITREGIVVLVRVYSLVQPQAVPVMEEYAQSGHWIDLVEEIPLGDINLVLSQQEFEKRSALLEKTLVDGGAQKLA